MTGAQARMARAALKLSVRDVAAAAEVSPSTVSRIEADLPADNSKIAAVRVALEAAGVVFVTENGDGPGVRMRKGADTHDALKKRIEGLQDHIDTLPPEPAERSPRGALNQMKRAIAEDEIRKLRQRKKLVKDE